MSSSNGIVSLSFADDKKIATTVKNIDDTQRLQRAIDNFLSWLKENQLEVNES